MSEASSLTPPPESSSFVVKQARVFLLALGFLTRLAPPKNASDEAMGRACLYYPFVGAILGLLLTLPFAIGLFRGHAWVQAWLYVGGLAWLTRALHLDGLADMADALGSGKSGEDFQAVLKDSRLGAFGAAALALLVAGKIICAAACLESGSLRPLIFAPMFGRCLPVILAGIAPARSGPGLGALLAQAPKTAPLVLAVACIGSGLYFLSPAPFSLLIGLSACLLLFLTRVAQKQGGYNGDYLGAAIVVGELLVLLSVLV